MGGLNNAKGNLMKYVLFIFHVLFLVLAFVTLSSAEVSGYFFGIFFICIYFALFCDACK